jgi:hypothetical protein
LPVEDMGRPGQCCPGRLLFLPLPAPRCIHLVSDAGGWRPNLVAGQPVLDEAPAGHTAAPHLPGKRNRGNGRRLNPSPSTAKATSIG